MVMSVARAMDDGRALNPSRLSVYLDNCCYNRPYDNQVQLRVELETRAKLHIQRLIVDGQLALTISDVSRSENDENPFDDKRASIAAFFENATTFFKSDDSTVALAREFVSKGLKPKDASHLACAIGAGCDYFFTTDDRLLKFRNDRIAIMNPIDFIQSEGGDGDE
jgi:predicted nucleic acid-binding protein